MIRYYHLQKRSKCHMTRRHCIFIRLSSFNPTILKKKSQSCAPLGRYSKDLSCISIIDSYGDCFNISVLTAQIL